MRALLAGLLVLLAAVGAAKSDDAPGDFDFYVLALSWSPSYCASVKPGRSPLQCDSGRPYAFVLHGLWPQYERGYPANCVSPAPRLPQALVRSLLDIMPSEGLVTHQWRKHGTCSGKDAEAFFALSRQAFDAVTIPSVYARLDSHLTLSPEVLEQAFLDANPNLTAAGFSVYCRDRNLREVRICLTKDLEPRACAELERRQCRRDRLVMPPLRGASP
ncbi:MAG: ribonuclease T2 [Rhodospirillales bacterium]